MKKTILLYVMIVISSSCNHKAVSYTDYITYLNKNDNGIMKVKYVNNFKLSVKYLPPAYLAFQDIKNAKLPKSAFDSIEKKYRASVYFLLTIAPDERKEKGGDIMAEGMVNYDEYSKKAQIMNFHMDEYVTLEANNTSYKPVISNLENVYGLVKERNIMFVFTKNTKAQPDPIDAQKFDFIYNDELFNVGSNHFVFTKEDINKIPSIIL